MKLKKDRFIKLIFIIIILIIIVHALSYYIKIIENKGSLIPTGNVDIFDINCKNEFDNQNNEKPVFGTINDVVVSDKNIYFGEGELRIFENPAYEFKEIIAPGASNTYQFIIRNNNLFGINVDFNTKEVNKNNINLKFRLKENNKYIIGDSSKWVSIDELKHSNIKIESKDYKTYSLDWKWEYSENDIQDRIDTNIGFEAVDKYKLSINIKAEMIKE